MYSNNHNISNSFQNISGNNHGNMIYNSVVGHNNVVSGNVYFGNRGTLTVDNRTFEGKEMKVTVECDGETTTFSTKNLKFNFSGDVDNFDVHNAPVEVKGNVGGDVKVMNANLNIKGKVEGNVKVNNGNLTTKGVGGNSQVSNGSIINNF
jgi:cytoskeletal protein CcmA (bactofilin family)